MSSRLFIFELLAPQVLSFLGKKERKKGMQKRKKKNRKRKRKKSQEERERKGKTESWRKRNEKNKNRIEFRSNHFLPFFLSFFSYFLFLPFFLSPSLVSFSLSIWIFIRRKRPFHSIACSVWERIVISGWERKREIFLKKRKRRGRREKKVRERDRNVNGGKE